MTGITDMVRMMGLAKSVMPLLSFVTNAPKPILEDEPKEFEDEVNGKKVFLLKSVFAFESEEKRKEFLEHDAMLEDLFETLKQFAEKQKDKK